MIREKRVFRMMDEPIKNRKPMPESLRVPTNVVFRQPDLEAEGPEVVSRPK
jgi:hypothetical protein